MNANHSQLNPIFRDRPLSETNVSFSDCSLLHATCQEPSDGLDALLRLVLVLCMLTALLICGWHVSTWQNASAHVAPAAVASQGFAVSGQHVF